MNSCGGVQGRLCSRAVDASKWWTNCQSLRSFLSVHIVWVNVQSQRRAAQLQTMRDTFTDATDREHKAEVRVRWAVLHLLEPSELCQKLLFSLTLITQQAMINKHKPLFFCELAKLRHKIIRFSHFCTCHTKLGWAKCRLMVQNFIKPTSEFLLCIHKQFAFFMPTLQYKSVSPVPRNSTPLLAPLSPPT